MIVYNPFKLLLASILMISLFGDAFMMSVYNINLKQYGILLFFALSCFKIKDLLNAPRDILVICTISILLLLISYPFWYSTYNALSYYGVVIAFIAAVLCRDYIIKILKYLFYIVVFFVFYEYYNQSFMFVSKYAAGVENIAYELNEKISGGNIGIFRSKSIFYGPLSLGVYLIAYQFLNQKKVVIISLCIICSFLANSRLAIIVSILFLIKYILFSNTRNKFKFIALLPLLLLVLSQISVYFSFLIPNLEISLFRFTNIANFSTNTNIARLYFWQSSWDFYLDYSIRNFIFGNNGYYNLIYENNSESGWLSLLVDNGILGFFFYLSVLLKMSYLGIKRSNLDILSFVILLSIIMLGVTYHLSATSNFLLWFTIFNIFIEDSNLDRVSR